MLRRWFMFGLALMLLTLCLAAWGVSYWRAIYAFHEDKTSLSFTLNSGRASIVWLSTPGAGGRGWHFSNEETFSWDIADKRLSKFSWLGFSYLGDADSFYFTIPLWFPTLLSLFLLWFAWRKARHKPQGKAFSIEPSVEAKQ